MRTVSFREGNHPKKVTLAQVFYFFLIFVSPLPKFPEELRAEGRLDLVSRGEGGERLAKVNGVQQQPSLKLTVPENQWSHKKYPGWLGYIVFFFVAQWLFKMKFQLFGRLRRPIFEVI